MTTTWDVLRSKSTAPKESTAIELINSIDSNRVVFGINASILNVLLFANIKICNMSAEINSGLQSADMNTISLSGNIVV